MLVCENCGATNEGKLTFCRTCGDRLGKALPLPTATEETKPTSEVNEPVPEDEPPPSRTVRPSAPPLTLGRARESKAEAPEAAEPEALAPATDDRIRCEQCNVLSPRDYRFCVGCGSVLPRKRDVVPAALAGAMMRSRRAPLSGAVPAAAVPAAAAAAAAVPAAAADVPAASGETSSRSALPAAKSQAKPKPEVAPEPKPESTAGRPAPRQATEEVTGRLVVIVEDGSEGTTLELRGRQMDIGSSEGDIILEEDRYLSPRHARLFRQDDAWYLRDLDSLNGIYRRLRKPAPLHDGDLILLGLEVLQFDAVAHAERGLGHAVENGVLLFGSPATARRARLSQRTVEGIARDVYHLVSDETTIGREMGDIVFTGDPFMSRRHAMVTWNQASEKYMLSDLSSSNGTYLAIQDDVRLENGDFIRLGQHLFRVDLTPIQTGNR